MRRIYTSTAHFRAPFDTPNISFAGLGGHAAYDANRWPVGRSYWTTHFYRAPYQAGYYQSGALRGPDSLSMTGTQKGLVAAAVAATLALVLWQTRKPARA